VPVLGATGAILLLLMIFVSACGGSRSSPSTKPRSVPLPNTALQTARRFIWTGVARKDLAASYELADPQLRQGLTLRQWESGKIQVAAYPVRRLKERKIDFSYRHEAQVEFILFPRSGTKSRLLLFWMGLRTRGSGRNERWTVTHWAPFGTAHVPAPTGQR
jgi:hypothetical protein